MDESDHRLRRNKKSNHHQKAIVCASAPHQKEIQRNFFRFHHFICLALRELPLLLILGQFHFAATRLMCIGKINIENNLCVCVPFVVSLCDIKLLSYKRTTTGCCCCTTTAQHISINSIMNEKILLAWLSFAIVLTLPPPPPLLFHFNWALQWDQTRFFFFFFRFKIQTLDEHIFLSFYAPRKHDESAMHILSLPSNGT